MSSACYLLVLSVFFFFYVAMAGLFLLFALDVLGLVPHSPLLDAMSQRDIK